MKQEELESEIISLKISLGVLEKLYKQSQELYWEMLDKQGEVHQKRLMDVLRVTCQFHSLKDILIENASKLGLSREQMEGEYDRRWKKLLDENLQTLEDRNSSVAAHVDDRSADELPE